MVSLGCHDADDRAERGVAKEISETVKPDLSRISLTFAVRDDDNGLSLIVCESLEASDQLRGKRLRMRYHLLRSDEYDGAEGTPLSGSNLGMSSHPEFFEVPTSLGTCIAWVDTLGKIPYARRLSVEWKMKDENDVSFVVHSSVYRVSATADRIVWIVEESDHIE